MRAYNIPESNSIYEDRRRVFNMSKHESYRSNQHSNIPNTSEPADLSPLPTIKADPDQIEVDQDLLPAKFHTDQKHLSAHGTYEQKAKISDFEMDKLIGAGNFAKVFKAFNDKKSRTCALKILKKENVAQMK